MGYTSGNYRRIYEETDWNGDAARLPLSLWARVAAKRRRKTKGLPEVQERELGPT
jgi:hypothetical protein